MLPWIKSKHKQWHIYSHKVPRSLSHNAKWKKVKSPSRELMSPFFPSSEPNKFVQNVQKIAPGNSISHCCSPLQTISQARKYSPTDFTWTYGLKPSVLSRQTTDVSYPTWYIWENSFIFYSSRCPGRRKGLEMWHPSKFPSGSNQACRRGTCTYWGQEFSHSFIHRVLLC